MIYKGKNAKEAVHNAIVLEQVAEMASRAEQLNNHVKELPKEIMNCPKCSGKIIEKKTKKGKIFYGCNNYPKCDFATWNEPINENCPNCQSILTRKNDKIKCSSCDYEK